MKRSLLADRRVWLGGGALVAVLLLAAGWLLFIGPELSSADTLRSRTEGVEMQNNVTAAHNTKLARQSRDMTGLRTKLSTAIDSLPPVSGLPEFTQEVTQIAAAQGVVLTSITVGGIAPATTAGVTAPAAGATTDANASAPAPTQPTGSTSPTAPGSGSGATANASGGQYAITVTVASKGSLARQTAFLAGLQNGPRRVLVGSSQVSSGADARVNSIDASSQMTTQMTVYTAPMARSQLLRLRKLLTG